MLLDAHHMPDIFQQAFFQVLKDGGIALPTDWQLKIHLLNVLALLDCLQRFHPQSHPKQCTDMLNLIDRFVKILNGKKA